MNSKRALLRYCSIVPATNIETPLFVKDTLIPINQSTVKQLFRRLKVQTDIPRLHPHLLRHTFATRYLENGGDIYSLQLILGHTSLEMVKKYVHLIPSKTVVDTAHQNGLSASSLQKIKLFASLLCDYAVQNDIVIKNYATFVTLPKAETKEKVPFSDLDLQKLESAAKEGFMYADLILIMCYTGWRINEFLALTPFSWDSANHTLRGGEKTEAGTSICGVLCHAPRAVIASALVA